MLIAEFKQFDLSKYLIFRDLFMIKKQMIFIEIGFEIKHSNVVKHKRWKSYFCLKKRKEKNLKK